LNLGKWHGSTDAEPKPKRRQEVAALQSAAFGRRGRLPSLVAVLALGCCSPFRSQSPFSAV
jgi:hypothetical protein